MNSLLTLLLQLEIATLTLYAGVLAAALFVITYGWRMFKTARTAQGEQLKQKILEATAPLTAALAANNSLLHTRGERIGDLEAETQRQREHIKELNKELETYKLKTTQAWEQNFQLLGEVAQLKKRIEDLEDRDDRQRPRTGELR